MDHKILCYKIDNKEYYLEHELFGLVTPILYTCLSDDHERIICLASDSKNGIYICAKIHTQVIVDMLANKITIREMFEKAYTLYVVESDGKNSELDTVKEMNIKYIDDDLLPTKGYYFDLEKDETDNCEFFYKLKAELIDF